MEQTCNIVVTIKNSFLELFVYDLQIVLVIKLIKLQPSQIIDLKAKILIFAMYTL